MSIQTRLAKQRYSELNLRTPTNEDLLDSFTKKYRFKPVAAAKLTDLTSLLLLPPKRDRYYAGYSSIQTDFFNELNMVANPRVLSGLYNNQLIKKLAYYILHPQYYGHSFYNYSITWTFNFLMSQRSYIMRQRISRGELPPIWNKSLPSTSGYYQLPKPMTNPSMAAIGSNLYDLVIDDTLKYLDYQGVSYTI